MRIFARTSAALGAVLLVAACSSSPAAGPAPGSPAPSVPVIVPGTPGGPNRTLATMPPASTGVDPDDLTFLADMMVHHAQAIVMSERAPAAAKDARVKSLAERIRVGQKPEIEAMRQLLTERGGTPPELEHLEHADHGDMPGMATPAQLAELGRASGAAFDRQFLTLMIRHHEGAVTMSRTVAEKGSDLRVGDLAQDVAVTQVKEIAIMQGLQRGL